VKSLVVKDLSIIESGRRKFHSNQNNQFERHDLLCMILRKRCTVPDWNVGFDY
jgi:hypothetical protein